MALNDCLSLFPIQALNRQALSSGWRMAIATLGEGEDRGFAQADFDDDPWAPVAVPRLHGATSGHEAIWYRTRFARPKHRQRTLLRFEGAFLVANVWLNGRLLGSHYGYFAPFSFDISSFLLDENVLAVCVEAPVEMEMAAKRHVMGLFNDSNAKPYPTRELGRLPEQFAWHVPMGLWQPVFLEQVGHVVAEWVHCEARVERGDVARLLIRSRLRNLDGRIMTGDVKIRVSASGLAEAAPLEVSRAIRLNGHEVQEVGVELALPHPQLWWPWAHGDPAHYRADIDVIADERPSAALRQTFGIRDVGLLARPEGWRFVVNGRPMFMRGATYCSEFFLDATTEASVARDLTLAREAHMDMLRVHTHIEPSLTYDAADRAGILLWQDFPLVLSYVHRAEPRAVAFFRDAVLAQVEEMVHLLFNHPSLVCYAIHHEPPWSAAAAGLGERHTEQLNRDVDEEAAALVRSLDPSRPVLAASGDQDQHLSLGWENGHWRDLETTSPVFVSEIGAQALPSSSSPVWHQLGRGWPVADDDPGWRFSGYHPQAWVRSGVGPPSTHATREGYIRSSQEYQAHLLKFAIERYRRQKFAGCGGVLLFQFVDYFPGITASILDYARRPKRAYRAVSDAFAPILLVADLPDGDAGVDDLLLRLPRGRPHCFRILCVNDDPGMRGTARLRWRLVREGGGRSAWWRRVRAWFARRRFSGHDVVELPASSEAAATLSEPVIRLHADGIYRLSAQLEAQGEILASLDQRFLIGDPAPAARRVSRSSGELMPGALEQPPIAVRR